MSFVVKKIKEREVEALVPFFMVFFFIIKGWLFEDATWVLIKGKGASRKASN